MQNFMIQCLYNKLFIKRKAKKIIARSIFLIKIRNAPISAQDSS